MNGDAEDAAAMDAAPPPSAAMSGSAQAEYHRPKSSFIYAENEQSAEQAAWWVPSKSTTSTSAAATTTTTSTTYSYSRAQLFNSRNRKVASKQELFSFNVHDTASSFMLPKLGSADPVGASAPGRRPARHASGPPASALKGAAGNGRRASGAANGHVHFAGAGPAGAGAAAAGRAPGPPRKQSQRMMMSGPAAAAAPASTPPPKAHGATTRMLGTASREVMDEHVRQITAHVKTGDDVIEFYARHGHDSPVKFFYCLLEDDPTTFSPYFLPYDLTVVSRDDVGSEYYTMSASGVVHMRSGSQSEFTPLGEWMREKSIFNILTRLKFFKYYIVYKTFKIWHKNVRQKLFLQVRSLDPPSASRDGPCPRVAGPAR